MPQIILPVENKSKNSGARALGNMRSRRSRVTRTSKTGRNSVSSAVKNQCLRLPALPSARTTPQDPLNQSQRAIASVERWPSQAIPIVRDSDVPEFLDRMREQRSGLVPLAIEAVRYSLQVKKDARIAIKILRDLGIPPHKIGGRELPQNVTQQESEVEAGLRVRAIANILKGYMKEYTYGESGVK